MTLVVSEASSFGIVMTGDSAVTYPDSNEIVADAVKVQYSAVANVGFALWGNAGVDHRRLDRWLSEFIADRISSTDPVEDIGNRLATELNDTLAKSGVPRSTLHRGIHVAGYRNGLPVLFHVHSGHENEHVHELRLSKDFPDVHLYKDYFDDQALRDANFRLLLNSGNCYHLRNGIYGLFAPLFDHSVEYAKVLRSHFNLQFPHPSLRGRLEFYKLLVGFVAGTLKAAGSAPSVNDTLSSIAFTADGLVVDEQLKLESSPRSGSYNQLFSAGKRCDRRA